MISVIVRVVEGGLGEAIKIGIRKGTWGRAKHGGTWSLK